MIGMLTPAERAERDRQRAAEGRVRWSYDAKGRVLEIPNGLIVVPYEQTSGGWYAVVLDPGANERCQKSYPRGGYNILVSNDDVETALERSLAAR